MPPGLLDRTLDYLNNRAPTHVYFRALAEHADWWTLSAPPTGGPPLPRTFERDGLLTLQAFSGSRAREIFEAKVGVPPDAHFLQSGAGAVLFGRMPPGIGRVEIDPGSPVAAVVEGDRLPLLREMSRAVDVENMLGDPSDGRAFVRALRGHEHYRLALREKDVMRVRSPEGELFALVFTAADGAEAFLAGAPGDEKPRIEIVTVGAEELFTRLPKSGVAGILFNVSGPSRACSFQVRVCDIILGKPASPPPPAPDRTSPP